jgi:hypothetical protein
MTAAERMRRCRERKRRGDVVTLPIAVPPAVTEALIDAGYLAEWDADDPAAVAAAISVMLRNVRTVTT